MLKTTRYLSPVTFAADTEEFRITSEKTRLFISALSVTFS
jgi:hypothetical protein